MYEDPTYGNLTYQEICAQLPIKGQSNYPCLMVSPLNCFQEGRVIVPGEEKNSAIWSKFDTRASFETFDFDAHLTRKYLQDKCLYWYPITVADKLFLGNPEYASDADTGYEPLTSIDSMRLVFQTLHESDLVEQGLRYAAFNRTCVLDRNALYCPAGTCTRRLMRLNIESDNLKRNRNVV